MLSIIAVFLVSISVHASVELENFFEKISGTWISDSSTMVGVDGNSGGFLVQFKSHKIEVASAGHNTWTITETICGRSCSTEEMVFYYGNIMERNKEDWYVQVLLSDKTSIKFHLTTRARPQFELYNLGLDENGKLRWDRTLNETYMKHTRVFEFKGSKLK